MMSEPPAEHPTALDVRSHALGETTSDDVILSVRSLSKAYPGAQALDALDLDFHRGEIHGIVGQNGAGKSTLIRLLSGAEQPDSGTILLRGARVVFHSPHDAQRAGIFTIYQELSLVPALSVAENIFMGDIPTGRLGTVNWSAMAKAARDAIAWLGFSIDVARPVGSLPVAQQQAVELAKALHRRAQVVLLDEPSSTLPPPDVARLFKVLRALRDRGLALIYISHRLDEVSALCDRVTVLRDGRKTATHPVSEMSPTEIVRAMIGRELRSSLLATALSEDKQRLGTGGDLGDVVLAVRGLGDGTSVHDVTFDLHRGEILGVAGLMGNGQAELASLLFGARPATAGSVHVKGSRIRLRAPRDAIRAGIGLLPEERKTQGLVLGMPVDANITMASHSLFSRFMVFDRVRERRASQEQVTSLAMKVTDVGQLAQTLSGGTQQKVVLAKWLISQSRILIFDEPTRGVDVGSKEEIYELIGKYVREGGSVVLISLELPEIVMCDRVLVLVRGNVVGELNYDAIDPRGDAVIGLCR